MQHLELVAVAVVPLGEEEHHHLVAMGVLVLLSFATQTHFRWQHPQLVHQP
jgi:hypothetical protein